MYVEVGELVGVCVGVGELLADGLDFARLTGVGEGEDWLGAGEG